MTSSGHGYADTYEALKKVEKTARGLIGKSLSRQDIDGLRDEVGGAVADLGKAAEAIAQTHLPPGVAGQEIHTARLIVSDGFAPVWHDEGLGGHLAGIADAAAKAAQHVYKAGGGD